MPELPEAETIVRGLRPHVLNCRITSMEFPQARYFRPRFEKSLEHYLGARITDLFRHGKSVIFQIQPEGNLPEFIVVRLGMTGQLLVGRPVDHHTHAIFQLAPTGIHLCFRDQRQFGQMYFLSDWKRIFASPRKSQTPIRADATPDEKSEPSLTATQPIADPFTVTPDEFLDLFWKRRGMIKPALMSQKLLLGVGNIYADESLFAARIHPKQKLHRLSRNRLQDYFFILRKTLTAAIELGGSSISDFVGATNNLGEFQLAHKAYGRTRERCLRRGCKGTIKRIVLASRSTHYCPHCQRLI